MNKIKKEIFPKDITIRKIRSNDTNKIVKIISQSMNSNEGRWAKETIEFHNFSKKYRKDDGRSYYVAERNNQIIGITGLHRYLWGPKNIVWLGWFAIHKKYQRLGIGSFLLNKVCIIAKNKGFRMIFIETYSDKDFFKARKFYEKIGFRKVGKINDYIDNKIDMVVYGKKL